MLGKFDGVLHGQKVSNPALMRIGLHIVRATLCVVRTAQRLHGITAVQLVVVPDLPGDH